MRNLKIHTLSLDSLVDSDFGYPKEIFKKDVNTNFVTVKTFIDTNCEEWRYNNSYLDWIEYTNDVYEYIDSMFFSKQECEQRKLMRNESKTI